MVNNNFLTDTLSWQEYLEQNQILAKIKNGARIGILPKNNFGTEGEYLLVWEVKEGRINVFTETFKGFRYSGVEIIFLAEEQVLEKMYQALSNDILSEIKNQIRLGNIICYIMKNRQELIDMGFEELIEYIGIPSIGTCH